MRHMVSLLHCCLHVLLAACMCLSDNFMQIQLVRCNVMRQGCCCCCCCREASYRGVMVRPWCSAQGYACWDEAGLKAAMLAIGVRP